MTMNFGFLIFFIFEYFTLSILSISRFSWTLEPRALKYRILWEVLRPLSSPVNDITKVSNFLLLNNA